MINLLFNFLGDIKRNYKTLILAFIMAAAFWIVVSIQVFPTIETEVSGIAIEAQPTEYMLQNNLEIVEDFTELVNIRIEGKRFDISGLKAEDFYAAIDLSSVRSAGKYSLPLNVSAKSNIDCTIREQDPFKVTLTIDEIISKEFVIEGTAPDISLPEGYYAGDITASPEKITVTGSSSIINKITKIEARSGYHGEIIESHQTNSEIIIYGENGSRILADNLKLSPEKVTVDIPIYRQKELPLNIVINYPPNFDIDSLKYEIQPSSIIVAAPGNLIDNLSKLDIGTINLSDISLNKSTYFTIPLPEGYKNLSGNNTVKIEWNTENYGTLNIPVRTENITITNAPDNFDVSLTTRNVNFTIVGPSSVLAGISENDFIVTANLLGVSLREGSQDVTITAQLKGENQSCWISGEYKVTINATQKDAG
ncbi:MAG: hypothetical protein J1F03_03055 [Oscillospiraceae bacterium]|nr:hypothetical protein [Oscillospiraceae bacterium]